MPNDHRNTKVVIALMCAMTAGAALLRWLEPRSPTLSGSTMLMAEAASNIRSVRIEYAPPQAPIDPAGFDGVILPSGEMEWRPKAADVRILMVGDTSVRLPDAQARRLLMTLGQIREREAVPVALDARSDVRQNSDLPAQAADLRSLLVRKAFID